MRLVVSISIPFVTLTMIELSPNNGAMAVSVSRAACDGTAIRTNEARLSAVSRLIVAAIPSGIWVDFRYRGFTRYRLIESTTSSFLDHSPTTCPARAAITASAVPQLPAPMIAISFILELSLDAARQSTDIAAVSKYDQ